MSMPVPRNLKIIILQSIYTYITLYTVDATEYVTCTAQIDAKFHEGSGKWRAVS